MSAFLWTVDFVLVFSITGKLIWLAKGEFPRRTPTSEAADVSFNLALLVWAAVLIARSA